MTDRPDHVTVRRELSGVWEVHCPTCDHDLFPGWPFHPWAKAQSWQVALMLATWHVQLHREARCDCCGRDTKFPAIRPLNDMGPGAYFKLEDDRYAVTPSGVRLVKLAMA